MKTGGRRSDMRAGGRITQRPHKKQKFSALDIAES